MAPLDAESEGVLRYSLTFEQVVLPAHPPALPRPLNLAVGLNEVLLLEGLSPAEGEAILSVGSTLKAPVAGKVRNWGKEATVLHRPEIFGLRRQIAFISPRKVLLSRFSVGGNIAFGPCYHWGCSPAQALLDHAQLIEELDLGPYLSRLPTEVPEEVYFRAIWARELVKDPELILAVMAEPLLDQAVQHMLAGVLTRYRSRGTGAMLLVGQSLENFYPLGHRLLRLKDHQLTEEHWLEYQARPLAAFLSLV